MSIIRKVRAVEKIFSRLETEINSLKSNTGIHCLTGCGKCCMKPDIEASPLEFLPLAFSWYLQGKAEIMLEKIQNNNSKICMVFQPIFLSDRNGSCGDYKNRGLICRLFGYATSRDKHGERKLVSCKLIKEDQPEAYQKAEEMIKEKAYIPSFINYYQQLALIDFRLANQMLPINEAIKIAVHEVMSHYSYRPFPKGRKAG